MFSAEEVIETFDMIFLRHLNVRTVTLGINLLDCADSNFEELSKKVYRKIVNSSKRLVEESNIVEKKFGIPIVNKRLAVTPISFLMSSAASQMPHEEAVQHSVRLAKVIDEAAEAVNVDFIGGYGAIVHKGMTHGDIALIDSIPQALNSTNRVCSCVNIADTKAGINVDAAYKMGKIIKDTAKLTADRNSIGCAKLVTFANAPEDNPFMAGAFHGISQSETTVNVGISGPDVVRTVVEKNKDLDLRALADLIKRVAFKITRVGELIGQEVSQRLDVRFGAVDLSLAPTPERGESIADTIEAMGIKSFGAPGSIAALAILTDAIKRGGSMATSSVGGISGAFIPLAEDSGMVEAAEAGSLNLETLMAMTSVCSSGLDMVPIPGDTSPEKITGIILDEMAIGIFNNKPVGVRIIPVQGKKAGDHVKFGGLFGESIVIPVNRFNGEDFIKRGGQIPPPITSLKG